MITLRLDPKLEQDVNITAKNLGLTKSEFIRRSIHEYLGKIRNLFGKYSSGFSNLSANRKDLVKNKITAKRK